MFRGQRPFVHGSFSLSFLSLAQSRGSVRGAQGLFQFIVKWEAVHVRHIFHVDLSFQKIGVISHHFHFSWLWSLILLQCTHLDVGQKRSSECISGVPHLSQVSIEEVVHGSVESGGSGLFTKLALIG